MSRNCDGVDDVIHVAGQAQAVADFTMSIWAYIETTGEGGLGVLFALEGTGGRLIRLQVVSSTTIRLSMTFGTIVTLDATNFVLNEWNHWTIRYQASDDRKEILKDAIGAANNLTDPGATEISGAEMAVGARTSAGGNACDGLLAEFRWWDAYLTDEEIAAAANGEPVRLDVLKLWWPLWGTVSPEPDASEYGSNGTVVGALAGAHPPTLSEAVPTVDGVLLTDKAVGDLAKDGVTVESAEGSMRVYTLTEAVQQRDAFDWVVKNWSE